MAAKFRKPMSEICLVYPSTDLFFGNFVGESSSSTSSSSSYLAYDSLNSFNAFFIVAGGPEFEIAPSSMMRASSHSSI